MSVTRNWFSGFTGEASSPALSMNNLLRGLATHAELLRQPRVGCTSIACGAQCSDGVWRHLDPLPWIGRSVEAAVSSGVSLIAVVAIRFQVPKPVVRLVEVFVVDFHSREVGQEGARHKAVNIRHGLAPIVGKVHLKVSVLRGFRRKHATLDERQPAPTADCVPVDASYTACGTGFVQTMSGRNRFPSFHAAHATRRH